MTPDEVRAIIKEKVEGVWTPKHDDSGHHYKHEPTGIVVDSVTTQFSVVAKPHLIPWAVERGLEYFIERLEFFDPNDEEGKITLIKNAKFAHTAVRDDAGNIGTQAHEAIENWTNDWIRDGAPPQDIKAYISTTADGRIFAAARSAEKLFIEAGIVPVAAEILVGDTKLRTAGTLDLLALIDGKLWVVDHKTSNNVNDDYAMQVAAYRYCFTRMTGLRIHGSVIAKYSKSYADVKLYDIPDHSAALRAFRAASRLYYWTKNGEQKLIERKRRMIA